MRLSSILQSQSLRGIATLQLQVPEFTRGGGGVPETEMVDRLLDGMIHNPHSQLTSFHTVYSMGFQATMDFAKRFPSVKVPKLGCPKVPCQISESVSGCAHQRRAAATVPGHCRSSHLADRGVHVRVHQTFLSSPATIALPPHGPECHRTHIRRPRMGQLGLPG